MPLRGRRQRALVALLVLHANQVVSADRLLEKDGVAGDPGGGDRSRRRCGRHAREAQRLENARFAERTVVTCQAGDLRDEAHRSAGEQEDDHMGRGGKARGQQDP